MLSRCKASWCVVGFSPSIAGAAAGSAAVRPTDGERRRSREGILILSLEGLLRMKEHGRLKDRADAEAIRKALGVAAPSP